MTCLLRVKNESRWIARCIASIRPLCDRVLVMDDHSTDGTPQLCAAIPGVEVFDSPFSDLNESRDKTWLLDKARDADWILMIDGDEMLAAGAAESIRSAIAIPWAQCLSLRILYLWDSEDQVRMDGVYGNFRRPSIFRPGNHRFRATGVGGNFHCSNAPRALWESVHPVDAAILHFGYLHREDRLRKYDFYSLQDPNNSAEDYYRHVIQGDFPSVPATAQLMHAGPLRLEALRSQAA
jgi:O-antigen biosynthesis protein